MFSENKKYDCIVIGGGPAGMMAAIRNGELKKKVLLLEKNKILGRKLLLTGDGRCNLSHLEKNNKDFSKKFGKQGDFLLSPFSIFGPKETFDFFERNGLSLHTEDSGRIFPRSNKSKDVLNVLVKLLEKNNVDILTGFEVKDFIVNNNKIEKIISNNGKEIIGKNYILTTGGKSYPITGSNGSGFIFAEKMGHKIISVRQALSPMKIKEEWVKELTGITMQNISVIFYCNKKKILKDRGSVLFTHFGITGPMVLNASNEIGDYIESGNVKIIMDLLPDKDINLLKNELFAKIIENKNRSIKNILNHFFPEKISILVLNLSDIDERKKGVEIKKTEILRIVSKIKNIELNFDGFLGFEVAMATKGGISLAEIDAKTMKSKLISNLFFAGEIIDLIGVSGGYNLQLCWTTGYVAGNSAVSV
jgi:hypothetical protein